MPMIVVWPSSFPDVQIQRGSRTDLVAELRDIFPTFLDVAGIAPERQLNGSSIVCLLKSVSLGLTSLNQPETPLDHHADGANTLTSNTTSATTTPITGMR